MSVFDKPTGPCANCGARPATCWWSGDGGALAVSHGFCAAWCEVCVVEAQIAHCRDRAAALPGLEARLTALLAGNAPTEDA